MLEGKSLVEVASIVARQLSKHGLDPVVVGGSAITAHVPEVYTSSDIDFAIPSGIDARKISMALGEIAFVREGRSYRHSACAYTLDFVADTPFIDQRPVQEFAEIRTAFGAFRVYYLEDAIADRVAAFVHWSDSESLDVAERSLRAGRKCVSRDRLLGALDALEPVDQPARLRLSRARERLDRIASRQGG